LGRPLQRVSPILIMADPRPEVPESIRKQVLEHALGRAVRPAIMESEIVPAPIVDGTKVVRESATEAVAAVQGKSLLEQALENREKVGKADETAKDEARKALIEKTDPCKVGMLLGALLR